MGWPILSLPLLLHTISAINAKAIVLYTILRKTTIDPEFVSFVFRGASDKNLN